jgi:hypothetical protein
VSEESPTAQVDKPRRATPPVRRGLQVAKMLAYFVLLLVGLRIVQEIFKEVSTAAYFGELSRLSGLASATLDATKNIDDLIVTFFALAFAFLLILPVAWVHMITNEDQPDPSLTQTLIMLSVIVAGVMLLLEDNLARSFSLVGVVAAVRYRNTLKDPKDAVLVFLSLGVGMACGLQRYHVALFLSFFECAILLVLFAYHTGAPVLGTATLLATLKASEKKGERTPAEALAWLTPEARGRFESDLETQGRYIAIAGTLGGGDGKKRANAMIIVETTAGSGSARKHVNAAMEDHRGRWRLLGANEKDGLTVLEYLGRVQRKHSPPVSFLERLRRSDPDVRQVAFRSLRKMVPPTPAADEGRGNGLEQKRASAHNGSKQP